MSELKASWIPEGWKVERGSKDYREIVITAPDGEQAVLDAELDKLANQLLHIALNAADSRERVEEYAEAVSLFLTYIKHADTEDYCKQFDVVEKLTESILDRLDKHRSEHEQ